MLFPNASVVPETGWYFRKVIVGAMLPALWKAPPHCLTNCFASGSLDGWPCWTFEKPFGFYFILIEPSMNWGGKKPMSPYCRVNLSIMYMLLAGWEWGGVSKVLSKYLYTPQSHHQLFKEFRTQKYIRLNGLDNCLNYLLCCDHRG